MKDSTSLADISIPGTHDSGARFGGAACEAQTWKIMPQMMAGIRYLDIRVRRSGYDFAIHHGPCYQQMGFGKVLQDVKSFLLINPSETIIMRIAEEHTAASGSANFISIWNRYLQDYRSLFLPELDGIPTMGEARGKVLVLRAAKFDVAGSLLNPGLGYYDTTLIDDQNLYKVYWVAHDVNEENKASLGQKKEIITTYLNKPENTSKLVLNHLTGAYGMTPYEVANVTNQHAYDQIGDGRREVGIIIMDYPGDKLVYRTIKSNFEP